jgi:hypothetical protein
MSPGGWTSTPAGPDPEFAAPVDDGDDSRPDADEDVAGAL